MAFRRATVGGIPAMSRIRLAVRENVLSNPGRITEAMYRDYLDALGQGWVAALDDEIIGFSYADGTDGSIWALFVDPDFEGRGAGRHLLRLAVDWLFARATSRCGWEPGPVPAPIGSMRRKGGRAMA
jgi:GNAT superfamily N-acetyltransferase